MRFQIQVSGAVIGCNTANDVADVIGALRHIGVPIESGVVATLPKVKDPAQQMNQLRTLVLGTSQESYLDLMAKRTVGEGLPLDAIWKQLDLPSVNALNGVWSGLARNCKKCGLHVNMLIERHKTRSTTVHQPTPMLLSSWRTKRE